VLIIILSGSNRQVKMKRLKWTFYNDYYYISDWFIVGGRLILAGHSK
jgi:hypothetical protein